MPELQCLKFDGWNEAWRADAAPCFLERLSEAMLHWGWRLAAEIESSHLMCIYIYIFHPTSNPTKKGTVLFSSYCNDIEFLSRVYAGVNS